MWWGNDSSGTSPAQFWRRQVARTALRHNLGGFLDFFLSLCVGWSVAFCCAVLILRRDGVALSVAWVAFGVGLLLCVAISWWRMRRRFYGAAEARVRLEWHLGLHNRLTAAAAGVGEFPPIQTASDGLGFRWNRIAATLAGSAALVLAAAFVPIGRAASAPTPTTQPLAWTQTAGWVEALKTDETVQDAALETLRERVDQLRKQPAEDWYSHSSLEAGDNLRDQTAQSIAGLQRDLQSALGALGASERFNEATSAQEKKAANTALANALKGLDLGNLPLNHELLGQLKEANLSGLKSLTPEQLAHLKECLAKGTKVCKMCLGTGKEGDKIVLVDVSAPGGKGGGEASAPVPLNEKATDLGTQTTETVSNPDLSHALPGDVVGINKGEHTVDQSQFAGPTTGGAIRSNGQGGEAVWRNELTPSEREVLKRFFK